MTAFHTYRDTSGRLYAYRVPPKESIGAFIWTCTKVLAASLLGWLFLYGIFWAFFRW